MPDIENNPEITPKRPTRRSFNYSDEEMENTVNHLIDAQIFGQEILPGLLGQKLV